MAPNESAEITGLELTVRHPGGVSKVKMRLDERLNDTSRSFREVFHRLLNGATFIPDVKDLYDLQFNTTEATNVCAAIRFALSRIVGKEMDLSKAAVANGNQWYSVTIAPEAIDHLLASKVAVLESGIFKMHLDLETLEDEIEYFIGHELADGKSPEVAPLYYMNNFPMRLPGSSRKMYLKNRPADETIGAWVDRNGYGRRKSEFYYAKTWGQFYGDIDRALREAGIDEELISGTSQEKDNDLTNIQSKAYRGNIPKLFEAYKILRRMGYSHSEITG